MFACGIADKDRRAGICPYGDNEEDESHKTGGLNNNKLALAICAGKPCSSKPLTSSILWLYNYIKIEANK